MSVEDWTCKHQDEFSCVLMRVLDRFSQSSEVKDISDTPADLGQERAQAFGARMMEMLTGSVLATMTGIGHELGLFDHMAEMPPATSEEIAERARLNERYVREWLATMAAGQVLDYDPQGKCFSLPSAHAAILTSAAGPGNMARWAYGMGGLAEPRDRVVECFRRGGGVPYEAFTKFPQLMAETSRPVREATLIDQALPRIPGLVEQLRAGIDVADIGCGQGGAVALMARAFPASRFTGYDFLDESIGVARTEAAAMGIANARFENKDVATLAGPPRFDFVTAFDAIHDQAHPRRVLRGISDSLRAGGVFLCVDIDASSHLHENLANPMAALMYAISTLHCMTVSLAQEGEGLGTMWGEQKARELFAEAGFVSVETFRLEQDPGNLYYVCRK